MNEATVADGEGARVEDAAAEGVHDGADARDADDHVVRHDGVGESQGAGVQDAAAPPTARPWVTVRPSMLTATPLPIWKTRLASLPLTASRPAPGPSIRQIVRDVQLSAGQRDRAVTGRRGEADQVGAGVLGVRDGRPQRADAAVGEIVDREGAGDGPVLQPFDAQPGGHGSLPEPSGTVLSRCRTARRGNVRIAARMTDA